MRKALALILVCGLTFGCQGIGNRMNTEASGVKLKGGDKKISTGDWNIDFDGNSIGLIVLGAMQVMDWIDRRRFHRSKTH